MSKPSKPSKSFEQQVADALRPAGAFPTDALHKPGAGGHKLKEINFKGDRSKVPQSKPPTAAPRRTSG